MIVVVRDDLKLYYTARISWLLEDCLIWKCGIPIGYHDFWSID